MVHLKAVLDAVDPRVWYMIAGAFVWLATYAWRRFLPAVWAAATSKNPALPQLWMAVIGSLIALQPALGQPLVKAVEQVLITAALATIGANGLHGFLKSLPSKIGSMPFVPYDGARQKVKAACEQRGDATSPG